MRQLLTFGLAILLFASVAYSYQEQPFSAQQIIDRVISRYASCDRYVDEGEVRTIFLEASGRRTVIKPFTTAFVRPSGFRFEYRHRYGEGEWNRYIIWKGPESVKTWWSIKPEVESSQDISRALAAAAGVSSLASTTVPTLLMPELRIGNRIKSLSQLNLMSEEEVNGSSAYKIEATDARHTPVTLWVDKEALLIVKMFQRRKFDGFETETTTTYRPQVNIEVAEEKLAFNAPLDENPRF
jgi:hypothetical protein